LLSSRGGKDKDSLEGIDSSHSSYSQAAEKRPFAALPSFFVVAAYIQIRLTPQDCLPDRQGKAAGALHLGIFEQPAKSGLFSTLLRECSDLGEG
jgi:hypothetical protein